MKLSNKTAIVTGGAGGIGQGIVRHFLSEGAKVAIVDITQEQDDKLAADLADLGVAIFICKDISLPESAAEIVAETVERFGKLDILVNNAHASKQAPIWKPLRKSGTSPSVPELWPLFT